MKFKLLLLCCIFWMAGSAQNLVSVSSFSVPKPTPANTADWASLPALMVVATATGTTLPAALIEGKVAFTIKSNGSKVCGGNLIDASFATRTRIYKASEISGMLGGCVLRPGTYQLCVQFFGNTNGSMVPISAEKCSNDFVIDKPVDPTNPTTQTDTKYTPPQNINPADKKVLSEKEIKAPLTFRWTPLVPRPRDPIIYRLNVWQVKDGQKPAQALRANSPVLQEEVKGVTQFVKQNLMGDIEMVTGSANLVWNVQAVNEQGVVLGSSEPTVFSVGPTYNIYIDSLKIECPISGVAGYTYNFKVKICNPNTGTAIYDKLELVTTNGIVLSTPINIATTSPAIGTLIPAGGCIWVIGNFNYGSVLNQGCLKGHIKDQTYPTLSEAGNFTCYTLECRCNLCDTNIVKWTLPQQITYNLSLTNNVAALSGPIKFGPYPIVKLSTEIVDFYWYTEGDCKKCNDKDFYFGNLISGGLSGMEGGTSVAGPGGTPIPTSHQLDFISSSTAGVNLNGNINLFISVPPQTQLSCCTDCFRFCIRYTATFMQNGVCKTCSIVKCYESKRVHKKLFLEQAKNFCGEYIIKDLPIEQTQQK